MKKIIFLFVFSIVSFMPLSCLAQEEMISAKGVVLDVQMETREVTEEDFMMEESMIGGTYEEQILSVELLSGKDKGETVSIVNDLKGNPFDIKVNKGDKVFLYGMVMNGETTYYVRDFWHLDMLLFWIIFFFAIILVVGKMQGLKALFTLGVSLLIIFGIYIPWVQDGSNPMFVAIMISLLVSIITLPIIHGMSKKALVSIVGTVGGIFVAVLFSYLVGAFSHINGLGTEDMRLFASSFPDLNFRGILFSGIIIGALGAIMDVAVSISSGLQEVKEHKKHISFSEMYASGITIGKDIMGSMLNTLIFAYVGTSIAVVLIISVNQVNMMEFLNYDFVAEEIIRSIIGSLGLLSTIPVTALVAAYVHKKRHI